MTHSIDPGLVPPRPGLEKEEPELAQEEDIPTEDRGVSRDSDGEANPWRDGERE